jgi:hypothetical protein
VSGGGSPSPSATGTSLGVAYVPSLTTTATGYWFDASGSITFSTSTGGTGEQWTPVPASISATLSQTQVVSMRHQWLVTFSQTGLTSDATGTVATVAGATKTYAILPFTVWVDASSGSVTYSYSATVTSSTTGKQYVKTSTDASPVTGLSGPLTVTGAYKTQWLVTFSQTGVDGSAGSNTVLTVGSINYAYNLLPTSTWIDGGTTFNWASPVSGGVGKQFATSSTSGTSPITTGGTYSAIYHTVAILSVGTDTEAQGTSLTMSWSHTLIAGSNRMVVVYLGVEHNGASVSGVTYGGRTMTLATSKEVSSLGTYMLCQIWYILETNLPANSAQTVAVTMTGSNTGLEMDARCAEYTGVKQSAPEATNGASQLSEYTITNTISPSTNSWVLSVSGSGNSGTWTEQSPQTQISQYNGGTSSYSFAELQGASGQTSLASTYSGSSVNRLARVCASFQAAP